MESDDIPGRLTWRKKARLKHGSRPKIYPLVDLNAREVPLASVTKRDIRENPDDILDEQGQELKIKPLQRQLREAKILARKHDEEETKRRKLAEKVEIEKRIFKNVDDLSSSYDSESDDDQEGVNEEERENQGEVEIGDSDNGHSDSTENAGVEDMGDGSDDTSSTSSSSSWQLRFALTSI